MQTAYRGRQTGHKECVKVGWKSVIKGRWGKGEQLLPREGKLWEETTFTA